MSCQNKHTDSQFKFCPDCGTEIVMPFEKEFVKIESNNDSINLARPNANIVKIDGEKSAALNWKKRSDGMEFAEEMIVKKYAEKLTEFTANIRERNIAKDNNPEVSFEQILAQMILTPVKIPRQDYVINYEGKFIPWKEHPLYESFYGDTSEIYCVGDEKLRILSDIYDDYDIMYIEDLLKRYDKVKNIHGNMVLENKERLLEIIGKIQQLLADNADSTDDDTPDNLKKWFKKYCESL